EYVRTGRVRNECRVEQLVDRRTQNAVRVVFEVHGAAVGEPPGAPRKSREPRADEQLREPEWNRHDVASVLWSRNCARTAAAVSSPDRGHAKRTGGSHD